MKTIKTYSVERDVYESFDKLTNSLRINKSRFFQEKIVEFITENGGEIKDSVSWRECFRNLGRPWRTGLNELMDSYNKIDEQLKPTPKVDYDKYRILEKRFEDKVEFHPQKLAYANLAGETIWRSILMGTDRFEHGLKSMEEALDFIERYKRGNIVEEVIHDIE